jgi:hypothetical protein
LVAAQHQMMSPELVVTLDDEVAPITDAPAAPAAGSEG